MRHSTKHLFVLLSLVLTACVSQGRSYVIDIESIPPGKGIAILSTGATSTNRIASTQLFLVNGQSHKKYDSVIMNFDYPFPSDFSGEHGNLRSLILPEGWYYLFPEVVGTYTKSAPIYKFYVKSGEITYIGNLTITPERKIIFSSIDRYRDINLFVSGNSKFPVEKIKTRYMEFDSQYSTHDPDRFKIKGVIWGAP
jgi:hypothetical protein